MGNPKLQESNTLTVLLTAAEQNRAASFQTQQNLIVAHSPYSQDINAAISRYDEFCYYHKLKLQEAVVTRKTLIRNVDFDMRISFLNKTNRELILSGRPPFAYDAPDGEIELHHIGQKHDAPFAELTRDEHIRHGNNLFLHTNKGNSWRKDQALERDFTRERILYWKKRLSGDITYIKPKKKKPQKPTEVVRDNHVKKELRNALEELILQTEVDELKFYRDLINGHILIKESGAKNPEEFILNNQKQYNALEQIVCPHCKTSNYVSYGTYNKGTEKVKRYKCTDCQKTFVQTSTSIVSGTSFTIFEWFKFIECIYNGYSISKTSEICGISERAVHNNRLKLFYALKIIGDKTKLSGNIAIDETYVDVSYKGNHMITDGWNVPRKAHHRGKETTEKGLSKEKVCIVCAMNEYGECISRVAGFGAPNARKLKVVLENIFFDKENICLFSDKEAALRKFATDNDYEIRQAVLFKKGKHLTKGAVLNKENTMINRYIQRINAAHSRLKQMLRNGVSTALLPGYLYLFDWKENSRQTNQMVAYQELFSVLTMQGLYKEPNEISAILLQTSAEAVEEKSKWKDGFRDFERTVTIYRRYAEGETMLSIAKSYNISKARVSQIIEKFKKLGYAYKTEAEKRAEAKANKKHTSRTTYVKMYDARNKEIYMGYLNYTGKVREYYDLTAKKYGLSSGTIQRIVSKEKRIDSLKEDFYAWQSFEYLPLMETYQELYNQYLAIRKTNEHWTKDEVYTELADKVGYSKRTIISIVKLMEKKDEIGKTEKTRISKIERLNRDRSIFIDYMNWKGSRKDFLRFATKKYNLSQISISDILAMCYTANPERYVNHID